MKGFLKAFSILCLILACLLGGAYLYFQQHVWSDFYEADSEELGEEQEALNKAIDDAKGYGDDRPFVFLIAGIDTNDVDNGRTDALIVAFADAREKNVTLLSIPRDLYVEIPGYGMDKINAAYAYGGINLAAETVSRYLDVPIDNYFVINFNGFVELIDTIGGISLNVEKDMRFHDRITNQWVSFTKGPQLLNGREALNYARFRKDAEGDFGRMRRQQQVVSELVSQTAVLDNVGKVSEIINVLGRNMKTNVLFNDASKLAVSFVGTTKGDITSLNVSAYPTSLNGVSYVAINEVELQNLKTDIERLLKREQVTVY